MNKFYPAFLILVFIVGTFNLHAQDQQTLTLEESIEIAKQNSPLSRAANFALISSKWRYKSFQADLLPSLDLDG
ncbi:MAG TPA: TolC family protein, partial [Balneolaceae bacterium]|nr:TolC family protein [Balneolaceae bacterium]